GCELPQFLLRDNASPQRRRDSVLGTICRAVGARAEPCLSQVVSFPVWFLPERLDWRTAPLLSGCDKRPRRTFTRSPRAVPWEIALPWVTVMIIQNAVAAPVRAARGRGSACAKVVGASTSHGVGTSATARMPTAYVRCVDGRRPGGRLDGVSRQRPKPRMPRL